MIIGDTLQALFDGDDLNHNVQAGEFMRRWRPLTQLSGKPAVVIAAHPVKNATLENLIPYGGGAILNEIDGNLTLSLGAGATELHWQGKLRGVEFDPVKFRFEALTSPDVKDVKGREVQLPVLRPIDEADVDQQEKEAIDRTIALLTAIRDEPGASLGALATATSIPKSSVDRTLKSLAKPASGKLVKKTLDKWTLTPAGREAIEAPK
ncbi:MAG: helix-turn-helix domain-containing protein [Roseiarcus sp.]